MDLFCTTCTNPNVTSMLHMGCFWPRFDVILTFDLADGVITGADLGHGDVEVQFEGEDSPCEENYKHHKCSILKICELNLEVETDDGYQVWFRSYFVWDLRHYFTHLQWAELHSPSNGWVWRGGLEPHALPVGRLNILWGEGQFCRNTSRLSEHPRLPVHTAHPISQHLRVQAAGTLYRKPNFRIHCTDQIVVSNL